MEECYMADDFKAISVDCTFRLMFALLGQVSYRTPNAIREEQAIAAADMVHALCSVRGITGAVLALEPLHAESAANIIAMLRRVFLAKHLARVQFVIATIRLGISSNCFKTFVRLSRPWRPIPCTLCSFMSRHNGESAVLARTSCPVSWDALPRVPVWMLLSTTGVRPPRTQLRILSQCDAILLDE
jgi:hypothetical protein